MLRAVTQSGAPVREVTVAERARMAELDRLIAQEGWADPKPGHGLNSFAANSPKRASLDARAKEMRTGETWHGRFSAAVNQIIKDAASAYQIHPREILGRSQAPKTNRARVVVMERLRKLGFSLSEIARIVNREHTTVSHHLAKARSQRQLRIQESAVPVPDMSGEWAI
jgi:DNA-binding transcriptional ArsR family regulator